MEKKQRAYPTTGGLVKVEEFVDVAAVRGQPTPAERLDWPDPNLAQVFTASGWSLVPRSLLKGREAQWEMARVYERRGITVLASRRLVMQLKPGSDPHAVAKVILKNDLGVYETEGAHLMLAIREDGLFDPIDIVMALQKETCVLTIDPVWIDPTFQESPRGLAPPTPSLIEGTLSPMNRKKTWFLTTTGVRFDLRSPRAEDVRAYDIAQSLSRQNRFLGHTAPIDPYNVAQHSVLGAEHILATTKDERLAFEFLMHDAHEAYVGDIIRPLKAAGLSEVLKPIVAPIDRCVREKFGLPAEESPLVKEIDNRMLASERLVLYPWWHHYAEQVDGDEQAEPIPGIVDRVWGHVEAKNRFLDMLRLLGAYTENDVWIEYQMQCLRFCLGSTATPISSEPSAEFTARRRATHDAPPPKTTVLTAGYDDLEKAIRRLAFATVEVTQKATLRAWPRSDLRAYGLLESSHGDGRSFAALIELTTHEGETLLFSGRGAEPGEAALKMLALVEQRMAQVPPQAIVLLHVAEEWARARDALRTASSPPPML